MKQLLIYDSHEGVLNAFEGECASLQAKGLVFMIYSPVVRACLSPSTKATNHAKEMNSSWRLACVFSWDSSDCKGQTRATRSGVGKSGIIRKRRNLTKNETIKPRRGLKCRQTSGAMKPWIPTSCRSGSISCSVCLSLERVWLYSKKIPKQTNKKKHGL